MSVSYNFQFEIPGDLLYPPVRISYFAINSKYPAPGFRLVTDIRLPNGGATKVARDDADEPIMLDSTNIAKTLFAVVSLHLNYHDRLYTQIPTQIRITREFGSTKAREEALLSISADAFDNATMHSETEPTPICVTLWHLKKQIISDISDWITDVGKAVPEAKPYQWAAAATGAACNPDWNKPRALAPTTSYWDNESPAGYWSNSDDPLCAIPPSKPGANPLRRGETLVDYYRRIAHEKKYAKAA